jgi:hypothetical protein
MIAVWLLVVPSGVCKWSTNLFTPSVVAMQNHDTIMSYLIYHFLGGFSIMLKFYFTCTSVEHKGFTRTLCGLRPASGYLCFFLRISRLLRNCLYKVHLDKMLRVLENRPLYWIVSASTLITYIFFFFFHNFLLFRPSSFLWKSRLQFKDFFFRVLDLLTLLRKKHRKGCFILLLRMKANRTTIAATLLYVRNVMIIVALLFILSRVKVTM